MEYRILTPEEQDICERNCELYQALFRYCLKKCANPNCNFPMSALVEHNFSTDFGGKVCELCHAMEDSARSRPKLAQRWQTWKEAQEKEIARKKKILDDANYF